MDNFENNTENLSFDVKKLSSERSRRFNRYKNRDLRESERLIIYLNFTLKNTFWGNSWYCNEKVQIVKGKGIKTSININNSYSLPEVWDCRIIYYNSIENHNIYLRSLDNIITIQIYNNRFTCTGVQNSFIEGLVSEAVHSE